MVDLNELKTENALRWNRAKITRNFTNVAKALVDPDAKTRYKFVSDRTGVPWPVIAVIHEREASQNWKTQLGQGDPLNKVSVHIPAGRGPFHTWEDGAYDALVNTSPHAARWTDWSIGGTLTLLELYNGTGYAARELPSPYIWSGTDQYRAGKYVRDGVFDPRAVDAQLGCAGLLKTMMALDKSINLWPAEPQAVPVQVVSPPLQPIAPPPKPDSIWSRIFAIFKSVNSGGK